MPDRATRKPLSGGPAVFPPFGRYHQGMVLTDARRLVFLSGQLGIAPDGTIAAGVQAQTRQAFANIDALLAEAGLGRRHLVRLSCFLIEPEDRAGYMAERDAWVLDPAPASTLVFVKALANPAFLVEVEAIAAA